MYHIGQLATALLFCCIKAFPYSYIQKLNYTAALGFIFFCTTLSFAQVSVGQRTLEYDYSELNIERLSISDGLPSNNVIGVTQTNDGYLFLGTIKGLARYNGDEFFLFNPADYNLFVWQELHYPVVDRWDNIWVFNQDQTQLLRFDLENYYSFPNYWSSPEKNDFFVTHNGYVLLSNDQGIYKYEQEASNTFQLIIEETSFDLFTDAGRNRSFLLTENAFYEWIGDEFIKRFDVNGSILSEKLSEHPTLFYMTSERLFAHSDSSLYLVELSNPSKPKISLYESDVKRIQYKTEQRIQAIVGANIVEITFDLNKEIVQNSIYPNRQVFKEGLDIVAVNQQNRPIYSVYYSKGVLYVSGKEVKGISDVTSILVDEEGIIWVSTGRMGLFKIRSNTVKSLIYPYGTINSYSISELKGRIISSSEYGIVGVDSLKKQLQRLVATQQQGLPGATIGFTYVTKAGHWLASPINFGLWKFNESKNRWSPLSTYNDIAGDYTVNGILETKWGSIIIGSKGLVHTRDWSEFSMVIDKDDLSQDQIRSIAQYDTNHVLIGTRESGLWLLNNKLEIRKLVSNQQPIDNIRYIEVASSDTFYIGGWDRGIRRVVLDSLQNISQIRAFTNDHGLPNNDIHTVKIDKYGFVWASSNGGLGRINKEELDLFFEHAKDPEFQWFGIADGIINQEFNGGVQNAIFQDSKERLWFSNQDGLVLIDLDEFELNVPVNPYQLTIDRVYIEDGYQNTSRKDSLYLSLGERRIAFFYGYPNYNNKTISYEYRLEGHDKDWIYNDSRKAAIYSDLKPGTYTFEVRSISSGVGTFSTDKMTVTIPYFIYEQAWFQLLLGAVLLITILLVFFYQYKRLIEWRRLNELEQKTNEYKQRLFDGIAHELRTPLSLVMHPLERISLNFEGESAISRTEIQKEINTSLKNAERLNFLVDQITEIRQISLDKKIPLNIEEVSLTDYFLNSLQDYVDLVRSLEVVIEYNIPSSGKVYLVDKKGIDRIFNNLIMNAIRYNKKNGKVRVRVIETEGRCDLIVSNQGKGIAPKDIPHIFKFLYQGDNASNSKGSGIGLFLVKYWVDELGAEVKVESKANQWTTFTVSFKSNMHRSSSPAYTSDHLSTLAVSSQDNHNILTPLLKGPDGSQVILIVDDEIGVLENLSSSFKKSFTIWKANDPQDALNIIDEHQIDLIITDIKMPSITGPELVKRIREKKKNSHVPVIYYSALTSRDITRDGLNTGADIFVSKTTSLIDLKEIVKDVVKREKRVLKISKETANTGKTSNLEQEIRQIVLRHLSDKDLKADWIAERLFMSRANLYRKWKEVSELSLNDYVKKIRMQEAKRLLDSDPNMSSTILASLVGYSSPAYFVKQFEKVVGVKPNEYVIKNP